MHAAAMEWCANNGAIFQAYATVRNLNQLSGTLHDARKTKGLLRSISCTPIKIGVLPSSSTGEHAVALRFLIHSDINVLPKINICKRISACRTGR